MKIQFKPDLEYQRHAIDAVLDIFEGQDLLQTNFSVAPIDNRPQIGFWSDLGIGNGLTISDKQILENVRSIQLRNGVPQSESLNSWDFTIEMETGTGKTYVYLRTIFDLNRRFGFTKFIIVVPSVAIKEGVNKSLEITEQHFRSLYDNEPFNYFVYDSQRLGEVRNFATSDTIQVMVINIDAFRKSFTDPEKEDKANIIHRIRDQMSGYRPIQFIQDTNPIVIIDEPQSVDTTDKSKEAIASLNPLCTLRYSATHRDQHNLLYRLGPIEAVEQKLVKRIEVASVKAVDDHNQAYIRLLSVDNKRSPITARIEFDMIRSGQVKRIKKKVRSGDDLFILSRGRDIYEGYIINDIYCEPGNEYIDFTSKPDILYLSQSIGEVNPVEYKRIQIRRTIEEHLEKELRLRKQGIKVLSLFFIDKVANYRYYDEDSNPQKGQYARIFEEEYKKLISLPKYHTLFKDVDTESLADQVHNGYFAIDRKKDTKGEGQFKESRGEGKTAADESAYQLIMQDKERLLSFGSSLKFIFSHSALREGWDNPNVFQICTLNESSSTIKKRQEIGRGLRIAVNQEGERVYGFDVNTLTVIANESYEEFVAKLQHELEKDEGILFGIVEKHIFSNITIQDEEGQETYIGTDASNALWEHLRAEGYIDSEGKVEDELRIALKESNVKLPLDFESHSDQITALLKKVAGRLDIKNADEKTTVNLNKKVYLGSEFQELWERIKYKTTYRVDFNVEDLITHCATQIRNNLLVGKPRYEYRKAQIDIKQSGIDATEVQFTAYVASAQNQQLPDIISYLQNATNLTRRTLVDILIRSERLQDFKNNPQKFVDEATAIIRSRMRQFIVDGIKYQRIGDQHYYAQKLFKDEELTGYLNQNLLAVQKSVYDHVVYDSENEAEFARQFEINDNIKVYAKLPSWFKIPTPLGTYNPDWAVVVNTEGSDQLYFVVETKTSLHSDKLRSSESAKIQCGHAHFNALGDEVTFMEADNYGRFIGRIMSDY